MSKSTDSNEKVRSCPVQVVVRGRALNEKEKGEGCNSILSYPSNKEVCIMQKSKNFKRTYTFDAAFPPETSQEELYRTTVEPIVNEALKGFNCTIFAYGQTGTGKTHTMEGAKTKGDTDVMRGDGAGIIPRAVQHIFDHLDRSGSEYTVRVSFLELYNEELIDLLGNSQDTPLKIYDDHNRKGVTVYGLEEVPVTTAEDIFRILERGLAMRHAAETNLNKSSSRSHCIFSVTIHTRESTPEGEDLLKVGKLNLVDLAGAENIGRSGATDARRREAMFINQSLVTLGRVITSLVEKNPHIPYRESKLTRLLQESLGGRTKTCIIATISPASSNLDETISTLEYAHRAKNIRNKPEINQKMTKRALIKDYLQEIEKLRTNLEAARNKEGFYISRENYDEMNAEIKAKKESVAELETNLHAMETSLKELQTLFSNTQEELDQQTERYQQTKGKLEETNQQLDSTTARLERAQAVVAEQTALLQSHQQTEQELHRSASTLLQTLTASLSDVEGLHRKLERKRQVEEENQRKNQQFLRFCMTRLTEQLQTLESFSVQQAETLGTLEGQLSHWESERRAHTSQLQAALLEASSAMSSAVSSDTLQPFLSQTSETHQSSVRNLREISNPTTLLSGPMATLEKVRVALEESQAAVDKSSKQLSSTASQISELLTVPRAVLSRTTKALEEPLKNLLTATEAALNRSALQRSEGKAILERMAAEQKERNRQRDAAILENLQKALAAAREEEEAQWTETLGAWERFGVAAVATETSDRSAAQSAYETAHQLVEALGTNVSQPLTDLQTLTDSHSAEMSQIGSQLSAPLKVQVEVLEEAKEEAKKVVEECRCRLEEESQESSTRLSAVLETLPSVLFPSMERHQAAMGDVGTAMEALEGVSASRGETYVNHVNTQTSLSSSWQQEGTVAVELLKGEVKSFFSSLKEDVPTGSTPVKKARSFPTTFPSPLKYEFPSLDKENDANGANLNVVEYTF